MKKNQDQSSFTVNWDFEEIMEGLAQYIPPFVLMSLSRSSQQDRLEKLTGWFDLLRDTGAPPIIHEEYGSNILDLRNFTPPAAMTIATQITDYVIATYLNVAIELEPEEWVKMEADGAPGFSLN